MSLKKFALFGTVAAIALSGALAASSAQAAVVITDVTQNAVSDYSFAPTAVVTFNNLPVSTTGTFTSGGVMFTGNGIIENMTKPYYYMTPTGDTTNYLAAGGNDYTLVTRSTTVTLPYLTNKLGLYWGSIDSYNSIIFTLNGVATNDVVTGTDVANFSSTDGISMSGNGVNTNASAYVDLATTNKFNGFILSSSQPNFEVDNIAIGGVPEASTWAMMLVGFGGIALFAARRKTGTSASNTLVACA